LAIFEGITMAERILVIGLDGATWDILNPMMDNDIMPNLKRIIESGVKGKLKSTIPPMTPQAWTSFMTGVNPGKHGVFGFSSKTENIYLNKPLNRFALKVPTLWNILSAHEKKSIVINVPVTYPPEKINGYVLSGMFTPNEEVSYYYPEGLLEELRNNGIKYKIDIETDVKPFERERITSVGKNGCEAGVGLLNELTEILESRYRAVNYLMKKKWDLFAVVFVGMDRIQHYFYDYIPFVGTQGESPFSKQILQYYSNLDLKIGELIESLGENDHVIFLSDHGFAKYNGMFYINKWLTDNNWLSQKKGKKSTGFLPHLKELLKKAGLSKNHLKKIVGKKKSEKLIISAHDIDWKHTKAFLHQANGIRINLKNREPSGLVLETEYESTVNEIIDQLREITDTNGNSIIETVYKKEELYSGSELDSAPDIIIKFNDDNLYGGYSKETRKESLFEHRVWKQGDHSLFGIVALCGNGTLPGIEIHNAEIIDIMPTILTMLNVPIPSYLDGTVLKNAFRTEYLDLHNSNYIDIEPTELLQTGTIQYSNGDEVGLESRLQALGYLD